MSIIVEGEKYYTRKEISEYINKNAIKRVNNFLSKSKKSRQEVLEIKDLVNV